MHHSYPKFYRVKHQYYAYIVVKDLANKINTILMYLYIAT